MNDAIDDSDDEVDYSKMDLGNKKGPIGRWDFDTAEEYSDYMNQKKLFLKQHSSMVSRWPMEEDLGSTKTKMRRHTWIGNGRRFRILYRRRDNSIILYK